MHKYKLSIISNNVFEYWYRLLSKLYQCSKSHVHELNHDLKKSRIHVFTFLCHFSWWAELFEKKQSYLGGPIILISISLMFIIKMLPEEHLLLRAAIYFILLCECCTSIPPIWIKTVQTNFEKLVASTRPSHRCSHIDMNLDQNKRSHTKTRRQPNHPAIVQCSAWASVLPTERLIQFRPTSSHSIARTRYAHNASASDFVHVYWFFKPHKIRHTVPTQLAYRYGEHATLASKSHWNWKARATRRTRTQRRWMAVDAGYTVPTVPSHCFRPHSTRDRPRWQQ